VNTRWLSCVLDPKNLKNNFSPLKKVGSIEAVEKRSLTFEERGSRQWIAIRQRATGDKNP
jgi:hypothetical protein